MRFLKLHSLTATCRTLPALLLFPLCATSSHAMQFDLGPDTVLDMDVQVKYSAAWRLEAPESNPAAHKSGGAGFTLGDRNFERHDMISNKFSTTIDMDLRHKNVGFFLRPRAYYDFVYNEGGKPFPYPEETVDLHRDKAEILDAFAYAEFDLGDMPISVRAGRQVVSWGESLFIPYGISMAMSPVDFTAANTPGAELKDIFLPTGQVYVNVGLPAGFSVAGFYKFEWQPSRLDEAGSYFSAYDVVLDAGIDAPVVVPGVGYLGTIDQFDPIDASDSGQYGVALRYFSEALNGTEFGLYYINYHEHIPTATQLPTGGDIDDFMGMPGGGPFDFFSYGATYQEDIKLYGFSISAELFGWNIAPEISYREDYNIAINADNTGTEPWHFLGFKYTTGDYLQAQCSFLKLLPGTALYEGMTLLGEVAYMKVIDVDEPLQEGWTEDAWQYVVQASPNWTNVLIDGLDLDMPITFVGAPSGTGNPLGSVQERAQSLGVKLNFTYNQKYQVGLGYTTYFGGSHYNMYDDRDYVSFDFKYTF